MDWMTYYWLAFAVTLVSALILPRTAEQPWLEIIACLILAAFGFLLWPFVLAAAARFLARGA